MKLFLFSFFLVSLSFAQTGEKNANWELWNSDKAHDSDRVEALFDYVRENIYEFPHRKSDSLLQIAFTLAKKKKFDKELAWGYCVQAHRYLLNDEFAAAKKYYIKYGEQGIKLKKYGLLASAFNNLAILESIRGNRTDAIRLFLKSSKLMLQEKDYFNLAEINNNIGSEFQHFADYETAEQYYLKALRIQESKAAQQQDISESSRLYAKVYLLQNLVRINLLQQKFEKARSFLHRAEPLMTQLSDSMVYALHYANTGILLLQEHKIVPAIHYLEKSLQITHLDTYENDKPITCMYLAVAKAQNGELAEADKLFRQALKLSEISQNPDELKQIHEAYAAYWEKSGNMNQAVKHLNAYIHYRNISQKESSYIHIARKLIKENYKNQLDELEKKNLRSQIKLQKTQLTLRTLILIGCLLLLVFILIWSANKRKQRRKEQRYLLENLSLQLNPHFIFNALNSVQRFIYDKENSKANTFLVQISDVIREGLLLNQQRLISFEQEFDFLRKYISIEELRLGKSIVLQIHWNLDKTPDQLKLPALLLQPLAENSIWHGFQACENPEIHISVQQVNQLLEIKVQDNGQTFPEKSQNELKSHLGLYLTKNRVQHIYGKRVPPAFFSTKKAEPNGFIVKLLLPLIPNEDE